MFDRRLVTYFDWWFVATILGMALLGILTIYSANSLAVSTFRRTLYLRQITWVGLGIVSMFAACLVSYRTLARFAYIIFGLSLIMLFLVLLIGKVGLGAHRWIRIGGFAFQPSEFAKLGLVLFLARYFDDHRETLRQPRTMLLPAALTAFCMLLVLKQPDLGTALLLAFIALSIMLMLGLHWRYLLPFAIGGGAVAPLLWLVLKDYQRRRILVFLNPSLDPLGAGYHITQSKIAVGSGGAFGKGWLAASQSQLNFLPLNHTDFIFAVLSEQWGFLGCLVVLLAYFYLITKGFQIAQDCSDLFAALLATGISSMLAIQVLVNTAMVLGMMPVVGIPLPLLSYGGSSFLVTMLCLGLLLNIHMRRFMY
ncbi:MAG TPA: rod shape-determining protein RodA [Candidatus Acidoferrum sp.]|nr:rod shape-determining protein RodA [Candidatus Methylomirabilis sp.]HWU36605.1 rod shape-determining protein RodA [Candidatus Acidoferrum sp.]